MHYWLLRTNASSVEFDEDGGRFWITSRRPPQIERGDGVIVINWARDLRVFATKATVTQVRRPESPPEPNSTRVEVDIDDWTPIEGEPTLDDLRYSLTFITNTERPYLHFRRGFRELQAWDYKSIIDGEVFVARTGYFTLLHSLPPRTQTAFQILQLLEDIGDDRPKDFAARFRDLVRFVGDRILNVGRLLARLEDAAKRLQLRDQAGRSVIHAFDTQDSSDANRHRSHDSIQTQASLFQNLFRELKNESIGVPGDFAANVLEETASALGASSRLPREEIFEQLFGKV